MNQVQHFFIVINNPTIATLPKKNLSKKEMDDQKRLKKKRAGEEIIKNISTDLNKKRKLDEQTAV